MRHERLSYYTVKQVKWLKVIHLEDGGSRYQPMPCDFQPHACLTAPNNPHAVLPCMPGCRILQESQGRLSGTVGPSPASAGFLCSALAQRRVFRWCSMSGFSTSALLTSLLRNRVFNTEGFCLVVHNQQCLQILTLSQNHCCMGCCHSLHAPYYGQEDY